MRRHSVSPVTVSRAIGQLAAEGRVVTRPGSGAFVAARRQRTGDAADLSWQTVALGDRVVDDEPVAALLRLAARGRRAADRRLSAPGLRPDQAAGRRRRRGRCAGRRRGRCRR